MKQETWNIKDFDKKTRVFVLKNFDITDGTVRLESLHEESLDEKFEAQMELLKAMYLKIVDIDERLGRRKK